jgi:dipeptidyl aminopeptidase/acylaminoacyl peptidase
MIGRVDRHCAKRSRETPLPGTVTFATAVVLTLRCAVCAPTADAWATPLERVEFEGADQRLISGGLIRGDHIQGFLAKPEGAGPFPAVIGLHGCAGMPDTTKRKLVDELVGSGHVVLLVDSFATRAVEHACTGGYSDVAGMRRSDAYGALAFLARQTFVDPQRVAAVGFSQGGWVALLVAEANSFEPFVGPGNLRFRAVVAL